MDSQIVLTCRAEFSAAHFCQVFDWSLEENVRVFGKSANPKGHGHNYLVEVSLKGLINPITGMLINIKDLKSMLKTILEELDHKNLNLEIPFFQTHIPTTENLTYYVWERLSEKINAVGSALGSLDRVRVYEDESVYCEYRGEVMHE